METENVGGGASSASGGAGAAGGASAGASGGDEGGSAGRPPTTAAAAQQASPFECNICFEPATAPVVSLCGHLYCVGDHGAWGGTSWPCIHQWIESQAVPTCPVCKAGISKSQVIPIYCRGQEPKDPRNDIPQRPQGQRPAPQRQFFPMFEPFMGQGGGGPGPFGNNQFHFAAGFGLFPSFFGMQFQFPPGAPQNAHPMRANHPNEPHMTPQQQQQEFLSQLLLWIGILIVIFAIMY